jgi:hypothetical protein
MRLPLIADRACYIVATAGWTGSTRSGWIGRTQFRAQYKFVRRKRKPVQYIGILDMLAYVRMLPRIARQSARSGAAPAVAASVFLRCIKTWRLPAG